MKDDHHRSTGIEVIASGVQLRLVVRQDTGPFVGRILHAMGTGQHLITDGTVLLPLRKPAFQIVVTLLSVGCVKADPIAVKREAKHHERQ